MFSIDRLIGRTIATLAIGAAIAAPLAAATLVVRASGPSAGAYPPGKMLAPGVRVALKANDSVTLLDEHGTRTLRGPGSFASTATAAADTGRGTALAALIDQRTDRRVRIGAVRGVEGAATHPPGLWYVDSSKAGTVCVSDASKLALWRPTGDKAAATTIAVEGAPQSAKIQWSPGQTAQPWPVALPITDGARYRLTTDKETPQAIRLATIGEAPADIQAIAATLIRKGCGAQLDQLVDTSAETTRASGS